MARSRGWPGMSPRGTPIAFPDNTPPPQPLLPPVVSSIDPNTAVIGGAAMTMHVHGERFTPQSIITFNGGDENTVFVSETELTTAVDPGSASTPGSYPVTVKNGDKESDPVDFTFEEAAPPAPAPTVTSLNPASLAASGTPSTVRVIGTGFTAESEVLYNGQPEATSAFVSATEMTISVNSTMAPETIPVAVRNADGQESSTVNLEFTET